MIKSRLDSVQPEPTKFFGIYRGVVEDNSSDPYKSGKIKVRVFGLHTPKRVKTDVEGIPISELPWAQPALSLFEGSISGFGAFAIPLQGSHVFVFFENGNPMHPIYFASAPAIPNTEPSFIEGFNDPEGNFPTMNQIINYQSPAGQPEIKEDDTTEDDIDTDLVLVLSRESSTLQGTKGTLSKDGGEICKTLELPWKGNQNNISSIPTGSYNTIYTGTKYWIRNVTGRTGILIHSGNFAGSTEDGYITHSNGCILLGKRHGILQGQKAILSSKDAMSTFLNTVQHQSFVLKVGG